MADTEEALREYAEREGLAEEEVDPEDRLVKEISFHPFHVYSMRQAIEEKFILDVLQNYMTYNTCFRIAKTMTDHPDVPSSRAAPPIKAITPPARAENKSKSPSIARRNPHIVRIILLILYVRSVSQIQAQRDSCI